MSTQPKHFYSLKEYFEIVKTSEEKYEYWNGQVFLMSAGTRAHAFICDNLLRTISNQLGNRCRVFSAGMAIKVPSAPPFHYADLSIACSQFVFEEVGGIDTLVNPTLLVEVLSPSTQYYDRGAKFTFYQSIDSFREYLLMEQSQPQIIQYVKQEDNTWTPYEISGIDSNITLPSINCTLAFSDIYQDITFSN